MCLWSSTHWSSLGWSGNRRALQCSGVTAASALGCGTEAARSMQAQGESLVAEGGWQLGGNFV